MSVQIIGTYQSEQAAIKIVSGLELKGYKAKNITILTSQSNIKELKRFTDVKVESSLPISEDEASFLIKMKRMFIKDAEPELTLHEKLIGLGISEEQATECISAVESGKVIVLADDELKMGHAPPVNE